MGKQIRFDYYYGIEAEQFSFYRVPRLLIKDERFKGLSSDAKLLYGLMLDRLSLSMKNGWLDEENRAYIIYTLDNVMEDLGCAKATCIKIMKELDTENGIGLIEKKRRGLGKPDIIYVKNFSTITDAKTEEKTDNADKSTEVQKLNLKKSNMHTCNGVQREHNKKLNNGLPILHKVPPKRDYGRYFCIMAEKGGTSHGGLTEKLSPFFHAKKQEVNAYGR